MTRENPSSSHESDIIIEPGREASLRAINDEIRAIRAKLMPQFERLWRLTEFLPTFTDLKAATKDIEAIQEEAKGLPYEVLAVLVGNTLTEEGLPLFTAALTSMKGAHGDGLDELRGLIFKWTAEEDVHGEGLDKWLTYSGRIDMDAYGASKSFLLEDGLDIEVDRDPYKTFYYTSFQEEATRRSHMNLAKIVESHGATNLAKMVRRIAADESRHRNIYERFVEIIFETDPNGMMIAMAEMMKEGVNMPANNMREFGLEPGKTFERFSDVAQDIDVYDFRDYVEISRRLIDKWQIEKMDEALLGEEAQAAKAYILKRQRLLERALVKKGDKHIIDKDKLREQRFSWILED